MRDMEERGVDEEESDEEDESDVILGSEGGECVCVCERERVCYHTRSILFSQNLKQSNRVLK